MKIPPRWRWIGLSVLLVVILPVLGFGGWVWATLHFAYSDGFRTGYVQKISKKGWVCKSWEGELAMSPIPGSVPQIFQFSVRDGKVADAIESHSGHQVTLTFEQHKGVPTSCFGDTEYFVTGVKPTVP
jgi:hypothetical protein